MQDADLIIKNGTILTMDFKNSILENGFLAIRGDRISHMGTGDYAFY